MSKTYVGIDQGLSGAIAVLFPDGSITTHLMPVMKAGKNNFIDDIALRDLLIGVRRHRQHVCAELGQLNPQFGCKGNFSQGDSSAVVRVVCRQNQIPATFVTPREWQKVMHAGVRGAGQNTKSASIEACRRLFPQVSLLPSPRCTKDHDGLADALLIAEYARRHNL